MDRNSAGLVRVNMAAASKPVIGVTTSRERSLLTWWCHKFAVWRAGGRAVRLVPGATDPSIDGLDGLVIGGGDDIGAELYHGEIALDIRTDPERDALESRLLGEALNGGLPVLGICRGAQMINIHLGGNLHHDIYEVFGEKRKLRTVLPRMDVHIEPETRLGRLLAHRTYRVNSLHHQAVDRLGTGLRVAARDDHGVVQAIEGTAPGFLFGVQWHPEFLVFQPSQVSLYRELVKTARQRAARAD